MTNQFMSLLNILKYSVFGKETERIKEGEYERIFELAVKQGVFPLVYPAVARQFNQVPLKWEGLFLKTLAINERKQYCLKNIIENLAKENIKCCVLKGCAVANTYHMPECRASGDIDLLIEQENEKAVINVLENMKMTINPRGKDKHHFEAHDKRGGLIEVHVKLYNKMFDDIVLKNKFNCSQSYMQVNVYGGLAVNTLGIEDGLNFLTAHLIKHFVKEGCGIRQITDLLAYINYYEKEINMDKYFSVLSELRFEKFIKNILGIGVKYFDLEFKIYQTDMADKILSDVEKGGNFGFGDDERQGFYENFLNRRSELDSKEFKKAIEKNRRLGILKSVFLPQKGLLINKGYKYLEKSVLLYPIAYVHRLYDVFILLINRKRNVSAFKYKEKSNSTIDERVLMMKDIDIID